MTRKNLSETQPADLDFPSTFFEDAIEALENTETQPRLREIEIKAHFMAALADRISDPALHAEADKIARLAREKMTLLQPDEPKKDNSATRSVDLLRAAAEVHKYR
jgi:hypothetical protein